MPVPATLREINPIIDGIARGEAPQPGAGLRLAVALGLASPDGQLTGAGRAYACPALSPGPASLVMTRQRRTAAAPLVAGPLPLQMSLRRLLQAVTADGAQLVYPGGLGWPDVLLRPYLAYLEDLGLLTAIGPLVEVTAEGREVATVPTTPTPRAEPRPVPAGIPRAPTFQWPPFRYHLARQVSLELIALRGRRAWHRLQPLLEGPLAGLAPACAEWTARFQAFLPNPRRTWGDREVQAFAAAEPTPAWFAVWCRALLGADPGSTAEALARTPSLLRDPAVLTEGPATRAVWLIATALAQVAAQRDAGLDYEAAVRQFGQDGVHLPPRAEMRRDLEQAGLLVSAHAGELRLLLPVDVRPPDSALWPYAGPEWVLAALWEGHAFPTRSSRKTPAGVFPGGVSAGP